MSCEEQQRDELDALQAIYMEEFKMIRDIGSDAPAKLSIRISSDEDENDTELDQYELLLLFSLPKNYPDVGLEVEVLESVNLDDHDEMEIVDILNDMIPDNLGMAMTFTLVTRAIEWINALKDKRKLERFEEEERRKQEHEEQERKKFEGTRVTVESFIAWKLKFEEEMNQKKKVRVKSEDSKKLTGKEMFLVDKNLNESDLGFAEGNDDIDEDSVKVDESLFLDDEDVLLDDDDD